MQGWRAAAPAAARDEAGASTLPLPRRAPAPRSATRTPARQRSRAAANRPPSATSVPPVAALRVGDVFTPRSCARARAGTTALASAATPMPAPDTPPPLPVLQASAHGADVGAVPRPVLPHRRAPDPNRPRCAPAATRPRHRAMYACPMVRRRPARAPLLRRGHDRRSLAKAAASRLPAPSVPLHAL